MATRSRIGIEHHDGTVESIYCHFDGHPRNNGTILYFHYQTPQKIKDLIKLGDISILEKNVNPEEGQLHSIFSPVKGMTVAYHRDCLDNYNKPNTHNNKESYFAGDFGDFAYLYTNKGSWLIKDNLTSESQSLENVLLRI
jgi:hypothetical protein